MQISPLKANEVEPLVDERTMNKVSALIGGKGIIIMRFNGDGSVTTKEIGVCLHLKQVAAIELLQGVLEDLINEA